MPFSNPELHLVVRDWIFKNFPMKETPVLDIGAGCGTYGTLLKPKYMHVIGVEVWAPYIAKFELEKKYSKVLVQDVRLLDPRHFTGRIIVMGDIFEHLTVEEAKQLLSNMRDATPKAIVIVVPYLYEQGPDHPDVIAHGNPHEVHKQPDLTPDVFRKRYPEMKLIQATKNTGAYFWKPLE